MIDFIYILTSTLLRVAWKVSLSLGAYRGYG